MSTHSPKNKNTICVRGKKERKVVYVPSDATPATADVELARQTVGVTEPELDSRS